MRHLLLLTLILQWTLAPSIVTAQSILGYENRYHPEYSTTGMVAAQNEMAAHVGAMALADGGNAVDAAVAVGFALAVTLPRAGNIGGGGFMLVYDAESKSTTAIDYREMAPLGATRDMFLDEDGNFVKERPRITHLASGVPGTVAGLYAAHQKFGRLPWKRLVQPAVELARDGIVVSHDLATKLESVKEKLCRHEASCGYFFKAGGKPYKMGELWVQKDLARSLKLIARDGPDAFYKGPIADKIVAEMEAGGGLIDHESLAAYKPVFREPIASSYRGYDIVTMPAPSSGGVHVLQMLNILEHFPIGEMGAGSADKIHVLTEAMRLAYADRSKHLGDPDFYNVPTEWLIGKDYGAELAMTIDMEQAQISAEVYPGTPPASESEETTHFSIIDAEGNVVSNTYTLEASFGSGISVTGAGFLLNNEMGDFASKPGVPNQYGLLGGEANSVQAGKRPLSSMTPVIVFADGEPWFATGSPGGSMIITTVLQMIVNIIDHGMSIADAANRPRFHHQWYPDVLLVESDFSPDTIRLLEERGHAVRKRSTIYTSLQTVAFRDGLYRGASDPRRPEAGAVAPAEARTGSN